MSPNDEVTTTLDQTAVRDAIKRLIQTLPPEQQVDVAKSAEELVDWIKARGVTGLLAFSFVGASLAAEDQ